MGKKSKTLQDRAKNWKIIPRTYLFTEHVILLLQTQEEMALQIARMIVSDITTTTQGAGVADGNSDNDDSFLEQS